MTERLDVRTISVVVNGERRETGDDSTVADVVQEAGGARRGVAVAVNGVVVSKSLWQGTELHEGDIVEIVVAIAGG